MTNFISLNLFSGLGVDALQSLGFEYLGDCDSKLLRGYYSSLDDDDKKNFVSSYNHNLQRFNASTPPQADWCISCVDISQFRILVDLLKDSKSKFFIWQIPKIDNRLLQQASALLEFRGWDIMLIKGDSSTRLGIRYSDSRNIMIGKKDDDLVLLDSSKIPLPILKLEEIIGTSHDEDYIECFEYNTYYHKEPRPWSHVAFPDENNCLPECKLGWKYGAIYYIINNKVHRLTENNIVNLFDHRKLTFPIYRREEKVMWHLREIPYKMWVDYIRRMK